MKIAIGCDHGALALKEEIKRLLAELGVEANDVGTYTEASVDYPDIAEKICAEVASGRAARGIALCGTGIGISIAANKLPGIRCALCGDVYSARMARAHNDANVLALGGRVLGAGPAREIVRAWLGEPFEGGRHARRVGKLMALEQRRGGSDMNLMDTLAQADPAVCAAIGGELGRQRDKLELIASENIVSRAVMEAQGSVLTNKYAEGYPGKRYYGGCEYVDVVEQLAIDRAKKLFGAAYANVQPHSGAQANMAVFFALLSPGDTVMGMSLTDGGHLTHGSPVNLSGSYFKIVPYGVSRETETIDYDALEALALETRPKLIVAGASAYARVIDFPRLSDIAKKAGAYLMTDIAHIAGLVAAGLHPSPVPYADVVTTTTHKTLRGPRGGLILSKDEAIGQKINKAIFPGIQGGPLMHVIAAKAVAFGEALRPEFAEYQRQIVKNAKALAEALAANGFRIVTGGTDNHLMLVDLRSKNITGKEAQNLLDEVGITANKNTIPFEPLSPFVTSGIRLGSPALTTRGFVEDDMREVAAIIALTLGRPGDAAARDEARARVRALCEKYPLYAGL